MKKIIAILLSAIMCVGLLAGCGGSSSGGATQAAGGETQAAGGSGETYNFVVVNHDSANCMGEKWLETLFGYIAEESNGRITFTFQPGGSLFGATETIDAVKDGSADICWMTTGTYGGRFPLSEFINLVGNGINSAQMGSAVLNTMYKEIPEVAKEYEGWHVLALHGTSLSPISTASKKIETVSDLTGLRLRVAGSIPTLYVNAIGATAVALPTSEVYDNLSKNALDGMCNDWHNIDCFKLYEPIKYCMDVSLNMTASGVFMNQAKYDALPDDLKALFDKYFNNCYAADMAGYWWDSCRYWVGDEMKENGVEIYEPSPEVEAHLFSDEVLKETHDGYIEFLNSKGYDGQAMYDKFMEIVDRFSADYEHVWDSEFNYEDWTATADGYQAKY
ncbi:MAG: hypothetical protein E7233_06715 [Lachnospiraceae bacterium]|nr:hypothetical protein [Lachnospiraceae bacterium]